MPKKLNQKTLSSNDKKNKSGKKNSRKKEEKEEEEYEEAEEIPEENEEDEEEEEEEGENSFIADEEEEEDFDPGMRNMYRNEKLFKERDKKEAAKKKGEIEDKNENLSEDEKDQNFIEEEKEQEEAELSDNFNESDLEVVQEKKQKKKRRLKKVRDIDKDELKKEYDDIKDELEPEKNNYRKDSISIEEEDEDNEKTRNIKKKRNNYDNYIEREKEHRKRRDDDFIDYGDRPRHRQEREIEKAEKTQLLEQEFISEEDKIIINEDYPERLLTRYKLDELPTLSQEIKPEVEWICEQKNYIDSPNKKKKVATLLELYKKEFLDVPYIITYKYYLFEHELLKKELWEIFELDKEYQKLMNLKKKALNSFSTLEPYLNEKIYHNMKEKCIDNAKTIPELNNMMNYISYNIKKYLSPNPNNKSEDKYQGPIRKSTVHVLFSENLDKCAKQFCLDSNDIASNIELIKNKENLSKLLRPPEPDIPLSELLQSFKPQHLTETEFMENICKLIGEEMIKHPYIKDFVYEYLRNNCYVSTTPSEEGNKQLDVFHPSFRTKRIKDKPIKTFSEDDLFLDVIQREKDKLIEVKIQIKENDEESKEFRYIFSQALNSEQNNIIENNTGIKQEKDMIDDNMDYNNNSNNKSHWHILRENVIKIFFDSINKEFIRDIKIELKEKAEAYVINKCADNFYKLLMSGPYVVDLPELYNNKKKEIENSKKSSKNNNEEKGKNKRNNVYNEADFEEKQIIDETDGKFNNDELPKVMSFVYDPNDNQTYCVALNQNGELIDQKKFNFNFQRKNKFFSSKQNQNQEIESLTQDQESCMKFIEKHDPNLIVIGANDLKSRFIKDQISSITNHPSFSLKHHYRFTTFGDLSIPAIYSNSPISESEFPKYAMYIKQAISLGRYQQNPLQEILQLWRDDKNENYCLQIKLHPLQKYVDQSKLMEKMENKAIEVVNLCGYDINKAFEFRHLRNTLMFISGFGPKKAKAFIKQLYAQGKPKTRQQILDEKNYNIGPKLGESFINFIKIKTDITNSSNFNEDEYNLLDMTRIPIESYDMARKFINDAFKKEENSKKQKKKNIGSDARIEEVIRYPEKLDVLDINEYIKNQSENLKNIEIDKLKFSIKLIKEELTHPFRDLRDKRKDLSQLNIFHLLIGDDNFQQGMITVAKVIRIDTEHVQCKLQNDLPATVWFKDIFEDSPENEKISKEKVKSLFRPGSAFEARIKTIDPVNYKADLVTKPSEMISHKNYIPNVEKISSFFELKEEDEKNMPYINAHSQKNKKYQPRNIKFEKFKNMSYTDCCNYLRNKDIGECVFRPSSIGNNNLTLSYKFYKQIICHLDIIEEEKLPGENIGKKLRISKETYTSLEEILKRYVVPCGLLIKESIKNRKFVHCDTKTDFDNMLRDDKKKQPSIINYNYTILKDYPGYIVLGYVPREKIIYEYIKIKPKGLFFHDKNFNSLEEITNFFKKEYSTEKYRDMVKKSVIPTVQYHRSLETNNNSINLEESGNKYYNNYSMGSSMGLREGSNYGINRNKDDRICNICKKPGHIAKNCKNRDNYSNDRRRDNRNNNGNYLGGKRNRDRDRGDKDRDYHDFKKESRFDGWKNRDRDHGNDNRNIKRDKDNDDSWGSPDKKNDDDGWGSDYKSKDNDKKGSSNYNIKNDNKGDDGWGSDNNENKNDNFKSENDGW